MNLLQRICLALIIIGAINWGLIGFFRFDFITTLFGTALFSRILFVLVGISGLVCLSLLFKSWNDEVIVSNDRPTIQSRNIKYVTEFAEDNDIKKLSKEKNHRHDNHK